MRLVQRMRMKEIKGSIDKSGDEFPDVFYPEDQSSDIKLNACNRVNFK